MIRPNSSKQSRSALITVMPTVYRELTVMALLRRNVVHVASPNTGALSIWPCWALYCARQAQDAQDNVSVSMVTWAAMSGQFHTVVEFAPTR